MGCRTRHVGVLGERRKGRQRSIKYRTDYRMLAPNGIDPSVFQNRGAYGRYYAHQAAVKNGY